MSNDEHIARCLETLDAVQKEFGLRAEVLSAALAYLKIDPIKFAAAITFGCAEWDV